MTTKYNLYSLYADITLGLAAAGISPADLFASKGSRDGYINDAASSRVIDDLLATTADLETDEALNTLRILNDQIRFSLYHTTKMAAILLAERLPKRLDYRNTPRPPLSGVPMPGPGSDNHAWVSVLAQESPEYVSYLIRMAIGSDDYSAKLPLNEFRPIMDRLESVGALWALNPVKNEGETLLCRTLAEVDENGSPIQLRDSKDESVQYLHQILPVVHAIARFSRERNRHPFVLFVQRLPTLLVETLGEASRTGSEYELTVKNQDMIMDFIPDLILLHEQLQTNSIQAATALSKFHLGHPVYTELHAVLRTQHRIMIGAFMDTLRRFTNVYLTLAPNIEPLHAKWYQFLKETNIIDSYRHQRGKA